MLTYFYEKNHAISFPELEKALHLHDRTSVFRNLVYFEEMGFLHKLNDSEGIVKYALCEEKCFGHLHKDEHVHFTCTKCNNTFCLEEKKLPEIKLPKGFFMDSFSIIAKGICVGCSAKKQV
jgi:Fur family ferric uptake transcriptional regulator